MVHIKFLSLSEVWQSRKALKMQSGCEDFKPQEMAGRFFFNDQQSWWIRTLQCSKSSFFCHTSNPSVRICQGGSAVGITEWKCSQTLTESILRHSSSSLLGDSGSCYFICALWKAELSLKRQRDVRSCNPLAIKCLKLWESAQHKTETGLELESRQVPGIPELRKVPVAVIESKMGQRINQENL